MAEAYALVLIVAIPVVLVAIVVVGLCFHALSKSNQALIETNAMLAYNTRRVVDAIVTPPGDQVPRIEAEAELNARRVPKTAYPAPLESRGAYYPEGLDDIDDSIGGEV
jgi:hypothetical protein